MQAALTRDIQETMRAWAQQLQECALVFVHAPAANAGPLFQGEAPPLFRGDRRVRSVPFTTRRPTFSETKRVAQLLLTASATEGPQAAAPPPAGVLNTAATASIARQQQEMGCMYFGLRQLGALRMCSAPLYPCLQPALMSVIWRRDSEGEAAAHPGAEDGAARGSSSAC